MLNSFYEREPRGDDNNEWRQIRIPHTRMSLLPLGRGVLPGHDNAGKGPRRLRRSDDRIFHELCEVISEDPYVDASGVEVSVHNSEVRLEGTIDSRSGKRRLEDIAFGVKGVTQVDNLLRIARPDLRSATNETFR